MIQSILKKHKSVDNSRKTVDKLPELGKTRSFVRILFDRDTPTYGGIPMSLATYL